MVIRRPLVLRLFFTQASGSDREWGEFQHKPDCEYDDFSEVRDAITAGTERV